VLRVSLGCFVFFFVMFLSTVKARKVHDCRNSWHSEWWPAKLALWLGLTAVTFLAPSPLVQLYGQYLLSWPAHLHIYMHAFPSRYIYSLLSDLADDDRCWCSIRVAPLNLSLQGRWRISEQGMFRSRSSAQHPDSGLAARHQLVPP
jgi:hypothetical protein